MPYCSHCSKEVPQSCTTCPDCGQLLGPGPELELLITAAGNFDANRITAALKEAGVPLWKRYPGAGESMHVITGGGGTDVEIYVPVETLPRALEALENADIVQPDTGDPPAVENSDRDAAPIETEQSVSARFGRVLLWIFIAVLVVSVIFGGLKLGGL